MVKKVTPACVRCFQLQKVSYRPPFGAVSEVNLNLPKNGQFESYLWEFLILDHFGPILAYNYNNRLLDMKKCTRAQKNSPFAKPTKMYVLLLCDAATRCINLELQESCDIASTLGAIQRHCTAHSCPKVIHSDIGSSFKAI